MNKIIVFVSPTCGPCQLFKPQLKKAAQETNVEYIEADVSTEEGLSEAKKYNIQSSGQAIFLKDDTVAIHWETPCSAVKVINDINAINS